MKASQGGNVPDQDQATQSDAPKETTIVHLVRALKRQLHRQKTEKKGTETEHRINERTMARWTRRLGIFTALLVSTSFITICILYRTDQTARRRDRAFVYFADPRILPYPQDAPVVWGIDVNITNAGNMPARRVKIRFACPVAPHVLNMKDPFRWAEWKSAEFGNVIGPKESLLLKGCELPIETVNRANASVQDIFYVVEVSYIDGFVLDEERVTQMSRIFRFDAHHGMSVGFTGPHNCSDDDCPK